MRGLYKSTGYWQTQAAKEDWEFIADYASKNGLEKHVKELTPPKNFGWRGIDKRITKLKNIMSRNGIDIPPCPSNTFQFVKWQQSKID